MSRKLQMFDLDQVDLNCSFVNNLLVGMLNGK